MPFHGFACTRCGEDHEIEVGFDNLGEHDCPKCGVKDAVVIEWETEYDLDPVEE